MTVHELFRTQAARTPAAPAVVGAKTWTYAELDRRSDRLARRLRRLGVGPDVPVGVSLERSPELIGAVVAVLKAGGVFLPLDLSYPAERLAKMLDDAAPALVLTRRALSDRLPAHGSRTVLLDDAAPAEPTDEPPPCDVDGANLSYLIYTSGSTGRPKGVALPHRTLTGLIGWQVARPGFAARTAQFTTASFDVFMQEVFSTLCSGGALVLLSEDERRDPSRLAEVLESRRVERLFLPFVALQQLAEVSAAAPPGSLREVITAGEALQVSDAVRRFFTATGASLENQYGPSESHVVTAHPLHGAPSVWPALPPIGRAVAGFRVDVVDRGLSPVPAGTAGELCLAGDGLARGYLGRPAQTAERFVPDPGGASGGRLYRTGDLGRVSEDGAIEFLGRIDHQVKIRGFRVEPGEVEVVLSAHPAVREAAVVARGEGVGKRLAAYWVAAPDAGAPSAESLRRFLGEKLPSYMVPAAWAELEALPLTPSGKVDRAALGRRSLPEPATSGTAPSAAPRTPAEEGVAAVWAEVLGVERAGVDDDFFDLGGHSLLAGRAVVRLRAAFGVELEVRDLFAAPSVARMASLVESRGGRTEADGAPPIVPVPRTGKGPPLSFSQESLWFLDRLRPGLAVYNVAVFYELAGEVRPPALRAALSALVERHEVLRSRFVAADDGPVLAVDPPSGAPLPLVDLSALPAGHRDAAGERLAVLEARRPFDLERGPLLRSVLLRAAPERHRLFVNVHHAVADGWSLDVVAAELQALYTAARRGRRSPLPPPPVQYGDFAVWQRRYLTGERLGAWLGAARVRLAGAPTVLELPTDRPRPAEASYRGALCTVRFPGPLREDLHHRRGQVTPFMTAAAAFASVLGRWSGADDLLLGAPAANRDREELADLVGHFVETLALRFRLDVESFATLLRQTRQEVLAAHAHQELPFEKLVEEMAPRREASVNPLVQATLDWQSPVEPPAGDLELRLREIHARVSKFDLHLLLVDEADALTVSLEYSTDLFDATTAGRLLRHFEILLGEALRDGERPPGDLPLWTAAERQALLGEWSRGSDPGSEAPFPRRLAEQVARRGDHPALDSDRRRITYRELGDQVARLAARLAAAGVGPEVVVGLFLERSPAAVIAILAIQAAGGAYLPLDPSYPADRLAFMVDDSGATVLVTRSGLAGRLPPHRAGVVLLDADAAAPPAPPPRLEPDNLAYVIYTSGSTGRPKGAALCHRGLGRLAAALGAGFQIDGTSRYLQFSSLSFDASVLEIFSALLAGATLVLVDDPDGGGEAGSPPLPGPELEAFVRRHRVTHLFLVPSALAALTGGDLEELRSIGVGGEACTPELAARWCVGRRFVNAYGPTEATVAVSTAVIGAGTRHFRGLPIGLPIADSRLYVVDRRRRPLPIGVPGELVVGGGGLARGYLGRPALTAERFSPDPLSGTPGGRLYATGDRVRRRGDGALEFLGRLDRQVKVRGFRIELGEIEAALAALPAVREAVVTVRDDVGGALVAYLVPTDGGTVPEGAELRRTLGESLPEFMVPSAFVVLDALPRMPGGKVDRRALPRPERRAGGGHEAPRGPLEELLAQIWSELLEVERVGAHDDFFELGGHSLLTVRVASRVHRALGVEVAPSVLFEARTVASLARRLEEASGAPQGAAMPELVRLPAETGLPLSSAQKRLWFLDRLQPGSAFYNVAELVRLRGPLRPAPLVRAFAELVRRHGALRTRFTEQDGVPVQDIVAVPPPATAVIDLGGLAGAARQAELQRVARAVARQPFDLTRPPLLRLALARLGEDDHALILSLHHIATDAWSTALLLDEAAALYNAFRRGEASPLPALPLRYADFADWQNRCLRSRKTEADLAYWRRRLAGAPAVLELPRDRPRPAVKSERGAYHPLPLPDALSGSLRELSRRQGTTLYMTLLAAFAVLLSRRTGSHDLVVGTPVANRPLPELERLVGIFLETLALRVELDGDPSFTELLARVRRLTLEGQLHQGLPFERLVEELGVPRDPAHTPVFQVMLAFDVTRSSGASEDGVLSQEAGTFEEIASSCQEIGTATSKFDLAFSFQETASGLYGVVEYASELFEATTISRLASHFRILLEGAAAAPGRRIRDLPLLPAAERHSVLYEWSVASHALGPAVPAPADELRISELFAAQAARTPDAPALHTREGAVSYRHLDARANALAHALRARGAGPGAVVAVAVDRVADAVQALLGILKAGATYLPLDLGLPRERLGFMLDDTAARALVVRGARGLALASKTGSGERHLPLGGTEGGRHLLELDDGERDGAPAPASPLDPAYVIFTSGTTGRPKGVVLCHRHVAPLLLWSLRYFGLGPHTRVLQTLSHTFDFGFMEVMTTLLAGGCLYCPESEERMDPARLAELVAEHGLDTVHATPSFFREIAASGRVLPSLRLVHLGGEAVSRNLLREIAAVTGAQCRVYNGYGPTETSINCAIQRLEGRPLDGGFAGVTAPIGRATAQSTLYVLDRRAREVGVGVPGELTIGGAGVALGYLGRPALTAERFVPDPFGAGPGGRLYRSGDLARTLHDGRIELLGRVDHQVKIRGFRIELGEIEATLARHPTLHEAVVLARVLPGGTDRELVAYVAPVAGHGAGEAWVGELRRFLGTELPAYMVPAVFVPLDVLPRTPNGKVDRKALPEPRPRSAAASFVAPRTPVEESLAGIWARVLGVERVGRDDNFFALGGHSLKATRVLARLRAAHGLDVPLRVLFEAPTLAVLAEHLEEAGAGESAVERLPRGGGEADFPLSFAQERMWLLERFEPGTALYNLPAGYDLRGGVDVAALRAALTAVVARHEILRTAITDAPSQRVAAPGEPPFLFADLTSLPAAARPGAARAALSAEARRPFDLAGGPLLRALLMRLGEAEHHLLVNFHHVVVDGTSIEIFESELAELYQGRRPAAPPVQYADFAVWQRRWLAGDRLAQQLEYWRRQLAGAPAVLELPTDRPRTGARDRRGALISRPLTPGLGERLDALAATRGASRFMAVLAAAAALLSRLTGAGEVVIGSPVAGRVRPELEGLIGLFVNSLVLRCDLAADPGFRTLLERVRDMALHAYSHQDVPFERLVEELVAERDPARNPLFQVVLLLEEEAAGTLGPELSWRRRVIGTGTAKFDLTLHLLAAGARHADLVATAEYSSHLFDATTVARWLEHFGQLLAAAVEDPGRPLSALPLLAPAGRHQLLAEWRQGAASALPERGLDALFAAQAARRPDAEALAWDGGAWTYAELDRRSAALARRLRRLGVGREVPVAVALERSPELVATLLAVVRAGGFYVPLGLDDPPERLAFLLADLGVEVLVTRRATQERRPELAAGRRVLLLDEAGDDDGPAPPPDTADSGQLAYVLYTSGSTGTPKGVAVPHRAVVRLVHRPDFLRVTPEETFLMAAPVTFDASTLEIWAPLLHGARLALLPPGPASLEELAAAVRELGVTTLWLTAGLFHPMVESRLESLRGLGQLLAGGDVLSPGHCRRVLAELPGTVLVNGYGPTENTTFTTCHRMSRPVAVGDPVPVGRPIVHTTVFVVDRGLRPVPPGVAGELLTGGEGLARGYAGRPALTAAGFVPNPFRTVAGGRLYRTGDLARWLADGRVELLGRRDQQVKIRGFRIELGEIEAVLAEHPALLQVAVVARADASGPAADKRLVAYVVPAAGEPAPAELRRFLADRLPGYMVPSAFVTLAELPLTASGKVDRAALGRRALAEPEWRGAAEEHVAPRGPLEELVAEVWSEHLDVARVGAHDSFFELGGHSLLAARVISRLRRELDVEIPLRLFFEAPTVSGLTRHLTAARRGGSPPAPIERAPRGGRLPLSSSQQRLWFLDQLSPGDPSFNIPEALRLTGAGLDVAALGRALGEIVRRHEVLRTGFEVFEGVPHQVMAKRLTLALPHADLRRLPPAQRQREADRLLRATGRHRFDLARAPLLRLHLVTLDDAEHVLAVVLHHTVGDGASLAILFEELTALYETFAAGETSPLPSLPIQYADFALWQRRRLDGGALAGELAYWRERLAGAPPVLELPADRPRRSAAGPRRGAVARSVLPAELAGGLRRVARAEGSTLFMFLLAAFDVLLYRYTGEGDLVVGSPIARRDHPETEGLIGFFVNTVALRVGLDGDPSFRELLGRVRRSAFDAYAHSELPFDVVAGELRGERSSDRTPIFQVMLSLVDVDLAPRPFGALRRQLLDVHNGTSQLEWSLIVLVAGDELQVAVEYDRDRFTARTAERVLDDFRRAAAAAVADPETRLSALLPDVAPPRPAAPPEPPAAARPERRGRRERLGKRRAGLSEEKRALLAQRLRGEGARLRRDDRGGAAPAAPRPVSLVAIDPAGSRPPFFCVHPAGGDVLCFRTLGRHLGDEQPFYGLQARGLTAGQEHHTSIADMARDYVAEMRTVAPRGPYRLGGWSFGGLVAFEMAHELRRQGEEVALLAILDTLPRLPPEEAPDEAARADDARWLMHVAEYAEGLGGEPLGVTYEELRGLEDEPRLELFLERLRRSGILPGGAGTAELRRLLTVFKANVEAAFRHEPRLYPGRVTLLRAAENPSFDALADPTLGWGAVSSEPVTVYTVPGDHVTLLTAPHVRELAARLNTCLEET